MDLSRQLRPAALIFFILFALTHSSYTRYHGKRHKRQNGAHMYLPESFIVPNGEGELDEWSEWSSPSECSRSCGGGVSFQTRECLRYGSNGAQQCSGGSRKYFSCNTQDCPEDEPEFRAQQCSRFDSVPFDGVRYEWVPYTNAPNPCELNCMPRGERFYYRHKAKVIDGTRCNDKTLDVCVDGECQPVGCDMMLGSNAREDKCRKCAGDGSSCKTISGLFETNNLAAGYNDILLIPIGATNIVLKEVAPSNNYLACRNLTGHYYLNGNWRIDFPRPMHFAGSWWHYQRKPTGFAAPDQLTCSGPTTESIYVVMLIQDRNVGVQYEYSIPETVTKNLPDTYSWTHMEYSPCSASCGGGVQIRNVTCNNRLTLEMVDESLCDANTKPSETQVCGTVECDPHWVEGVWGKCSKSCGKDGFQNRTVSCERISQNGVANVVEDSVCLKAIGNKPAITQECNRDEKNCPKFHIGPWSPCDKLCGEGKRSRRVTCFKEENGRKKVLPDDVCSEEKPITEEICVLAPCEGVDWIISQWSACEKCGQTKETRTAICGSKSGKLYEEKFCSSEKPELSRPCKSVKCKTQWFTSQWSECSASCGKGIQSRIVICGEFDGTTVTPASDDLKCNVADKPVGEQDCEGEKAECPGEWFTGPWGECSKTCGGGQRTREVLCLSNGTKVSTCEESKIEFGSENCNSQSCTDDDIIPIDSTSRSVENDEDSEEECEEDYDEQDFGVEFVSEKRKEDLKLAEGIELDAGSTTLSSLIMDDLMLSDSPSSDYEHITPLLSTELPAASTEGSGEEESVTIVSTIDVSEGSGDEELKETSSIPEYTDITSTQNTNEISESPTDISTQSSPESSASSESPSELSSTIFTESPEPTTLVTGSQSSFTSESSESSSTGDITIDTTISNTVTGETSTLSTDTRSSSDISSTLLTKETDVFASTTESYSTLIVESTTIDATSDNSVSPFSKSSSETTLGGSTETTLDSSTESISDSTTETKFYSSTEITSDSSAESSSESSTESQSESSTVSSSESSTESSSDSGTESSSDSGTESSSESSTESSSDSGTESSSDSGTESSSESSTDATSDNTTEQTSQSSSDSTSESSTETTASSSSSSSSESSTESSSESSTESSSESSTESSSDSSTESSSESSTDATSDKTSDRTTEQTSQSSTDSTSESSTEITSNLSSSSSSESSTESSSESSTETTLESSTQTNLVTETTSVSSSETTVIDSSETTSDISPTIISERTTEITSEGSTSTIGSTDGTTDNTETTFDTTSNSVFSSSEISTEESPITDVSTNDISSTEKTSDFTSDITSDSSTDTTIGSSSTGWSTSATDAETSESSTISTEAGLTDKTESTTIESDSSITSSDSILISSTEGSASDVTTDLTTTSKDLYSTSELSTVENLSSTFDSTISIDERTGYTETTTEVIGESQTASTIDATTIDIWSSEAVENTEGDIEKSTPNTLEAALGKESKPRKCKPKKPEKEKCVSSKFGCCPDKRTPAKGPFGLNCPVIKTCSDSEFGCCQDGLSPALGKNKDGCPRSLCAETLFGCCPDNFTPAEGEDDEGCPEQTTEPPTTTTDMVEEDTEKSTIGTDVTESSSEITERSDSTDSTDITDTTDTTEISTIKTVKSCSFEPFACCPDGKTPAKGENFKGCDIVDEKDCSKSLYGCCRDKKTSARGPNEDGCALCTRELFGCCPDGVTPAHGALGEGCCLSTQFGCCPDNINAARGPNFQDCDCKYTPYGCCPDNTTAARGYNDEGCSCESSPFGCCPDKITPSQGAKFSGCPCHTMQFGCCPDGVTIPQGPHHYGCHCSQTQYKCCSDEKTPASGPNFEGCTCAESKYGCCPDGTTEAQGDKFEGCEILQESPQKACGLPKETGTCSNFTIKYFFDTSYGACARFWYGGCDGNGNRFETEAQCRDTCQEYKGKDTCLLPKSAGPCPGFQKKWYFNSETSRCEDFNYGGCYGTSNRFDSLEECKAHCSVEESLPPCEQPMDQGPCQGSFERWHFDNETDVCRQFTYGGCKGNKNNYATEHACNYHCKQPGVHKELCALSKESGNCGGNHARWYFSENDQKCMPFYFTGCGGNINNFRTLESCEEHCPKKIAKDICEIPAEVGECQNYTPRWYWDTKDGRCRQFYYGGCGGNANNFEEEDQCLQRCERKPEPAKTTRQPLQPSPVPVYPERPPAPENTAAPGKTDKCFQSAEAGDCDEYLQRWFYNMDEGVCDQFIYRGCGGNSNNFASEEECENSCFNFNTTCSLPPIYGRCNDNNTRWHYDEHSKRCFEFEFSGCRGNRNNFFNEKECMDYCQNTHPEEEVPHTEEYSPTIDEQCELPLEAGDCRDSIFSWYYNKEAKQCEGFYYTGCNGNANRFESREQCDRQCGNFRDVDVCNEPLVVGSCNQWETRFYFDIVSQTCEPFTYGGCGGSGNRFVDKAECQSVCIVGKEPTTNRAICLLAPNVGNCTKVTASERRWYYDDDRGTCVPFIYSGCSGNQNNFRSPNSCLNFCANQTDSSPEIGNRFGEEESQVHKCELLDDQCRSMQCPFGKKSEEGLDGCRRCECIDPCAQYTCPSEQKCAVDVSSNPSLEARFIPICRAINKEGVCPKLANSSVCHRECYDDADCRDDNKCCSEGCSHVCVRPYQHTEHTTTLSPISPRTEVIYPGESPAVLVTKKPEEVTVTSTAGNVAVLRCFATGNPPPTVTWRRGAVLIDTNKGRYILTSSGDLTIVQVHQSDSGSYICVASNGLGAPVSREINLEVSDKTTNLPAYIYGPKNITQIVTIKQPAVIRCPAGGYPEPHVNWWRGKNRMALTTARYDTKRDYSLVFRSIELSDLGPYECSAYTGRGKPASMVVTLKAIGPVRVTNRNDEQFLKYILEPAPLPTTSKPAYPFHPSRPQVRPPPPQVVELDSRFDGNETTSPPYRKSARATALIRRDLSNNYTVGSDVVLICEVGGYPAPNVTWSKDSKQVFSSNRIQITENPYRLVIYGVSIEDSGYYGCSARNTFSFDTNEEKILIESGVYVQPDCTDNKFFANCALIVKGRYCSNEYYAKFCCRSCTLAGQLPGGHPNSL